MFWQNIFKIVISFLLVVDFYALIFLNLDPDGVIPNWKRIEQGKTELYFDNHTKLPKLTDLDEEYTFQFTARNLEQAAINYSYEVQIVQNDLITILDKGTFELQHNSTKSIPVRFKMLENFGKAKVVVSLTNKNQQISFWMEEST